MEKMWKKVGLHTSRRKRDREKDKKKVETSVENDQSNYQDEGTVRSSYVIKNGDEYVLVERRRRRRRRSTSRRPPARLRIFGIEWPLHSNDSRLNERYRYIDCFERYIVDNIGQALPKVEMLSAILTSSKTLSITRRLCGRRGDDDNQLYRSNSFRFERFPNQDAHSAVNTCPRGGDKFWLDEYSQPLDQVGRTNRQQKRISFPGTSQVELIETYCDPRDSKRPEEFLQNPSILDSPSRYATGKQQYLSQGQISNQYLTNASSDFSQGQLDGEFLNLLESPSQCCPTSHLCHGRTSSEAFDFPGDSSTQGRFSGEFQNLLETPGQDRGSPPEPAPSRGSRRDFSQPYTTDGSSGEASSSELSLAPSTSGRAPTLPPGPRRPPRYAQPKKIQNKQRNKSLEHQYANVSGGKTTSLRQPSPYYYGDLARCGKAATIDTAAVSNRSQFDKRFSFTEDGLFLQEAEGEEGSSSEDSVCSMPPGRACACRLPDDLPRTIFYLGPEMTARARRLYETAFDSKVARSDDDLDDVDRVSNHPLLLQLTGDGRVLGIDTFASSSSSTIDPISSIVCEKTRRKLQPRSENNRRPKNVPNRNQIDNSVGSMLSEEMENLGINGADEKDSSVSNLPLRGYTPSPPSTAPLPTKFQQAKDNHAMNSIKSAPNLPSQPAHPRLKDLRLPVKSLRARDSPASSEGSMLEIKERTNNNASEFECGNRVRNMIQGNKERVSENKGAVRLNNGLFLEIKGRPASDTDTPKMHRYRGVKESGPILEFKGRPSNRRRHKYSSTESMATSSSGGSMESLRSSTSEGNRSTSSSDSRHSSSLSSHSSDSGNNSRFPNLHLNNSLGGFVSHHVNKLHILSPISDKSSQEPASETSENNKNNNSQKVSPEDNENTAMNVQGNGDSNVKFKRRPPINKNLLNLAFQHATAGENEIQGSDSGISIHSREGIKSRNAFLGFLKLNQAPVDSNSTNSIAVDVNNGQDFSDLPFDMPKLRRRRAANQDACTSGSATSVDLRDLPFDMPKLRRRLRAPASSSPASSGGSQASSSHSVQDAEKAQGNGRPNLTLNFEDKNVLVSATTESGRGLALNLGAVTVPVLADVVDTALPLERQGWYHGAMTRLEAEAVLRTSSEGGFLVRNSESARKDYSLSLKSARGFMHMRIQKSDENGKYILGQFSRPFDNIPEMIRHFCLNRLPVRGAEHMCLSKPVIAQLL